MFCRYMQASRLLHFFSVLKSVLNYEWLQSLISLEFCAKLVALIRQGWTHIIQPEQIRCKAFTQNRLQTTRRGQLDY